MKRGRLFSVLALILLSLPVARTTAAEIYPRIINGTPVAEFSDETLREDLKPVGIVASMAFESGFCTGTLISPTHVLTAAHCAEFIGGPTDGLFIVEGVSYMTSRILIHPNYDSDTLENDIAILELSEPVTGITPAVICRTAPQVNQELLIVGFGGGGDASSGSDGNFGVKMAGVTTIEEVTTTLVIWNFDDPSEANTAPGDSGGPGFLDVNGELCIACITSGGTEENAGLGDMAFNTRIDAFANWIDGIVSPPPPPAENRCPGRPGRRPHRGQRRPGLLIQLLHHHHGHSHKQPIKQVLQTLNLPAVISSLKKSSPTGLHVARPPKLSVSGIRIGSSRPAKQGTQSTPRFNEQSRKKPVGIRIGRPRRSQSSR